jgi:DNA-binding transcriptional regulator YhcF (GntR family)
MQMVYYPLNTSSAKITHQRNLGAVSMKNANFNNRDPVYVQVVRHFKEEMATGMLEPGQEIPSRRELANKLKINPNTAQRAYKEMEEEGLIYTERNLPSRITKDEQILKTVREELILQAVNAFVHSIHSINVPVNEVLELVKEKYAEESMDKRGEKHD